MEPVNHVRIQAGWEVWCEMWEKLCKVEDEGAESMDKKTTKKINEILLQQKKEDIKHYPVNKQIKMLQQFNETKHDFMDDIRLDMGVRRAENSDTHEEIKQKIRRDYLRGRVLDWYEEQLQARGLIVKK